MHLCGDYIPFSASLPEGRSGGLCGPLKNETMVQLLLRYDESRPSPNLSF